MTKKTRLEKRRQKLAAFEALADGQTVSHAAKVSGVNKGSVSRWSRSKEYAVWLANREKNATAEILPKFCGVGGTPDDPPPEVRARFIQALRLTGRMDIAAAHSGATPDAVARWMVSGDFEAMQAHAEPFLQAAQVVRNLMLGKDANGNYADVKPGDQLRAACQYLDMMDWRQELPHLKIDIEAGRAAVTLGKDGGPSPLQMMIESMRSEFLEPLTIPVKVET